MDHCEPTGDDTGNGWVWRAPLDIQEDKGLTGLPLLSGRPPDLPLRTGLSLLLVAEHGETEGPQRPLAPGS